MAGAKYNRWADGTLYFRDLKESMQNSIRADIAYAYNQKRITKKLYDSLMLAIKNGRDVTIGTYYPVFQFEVE